MTSDPNGRTHEPSLREMTVELDGLRDVLLAKLEALKDKLEERHSLYKERDESRKTAVDAALTSVKEQTKASFEASEKAIVKAEEAQRSYNQSHNDLARKMDEQNKATMPRAETESRFRATEEKIEEIRNAMSQGSGVIIGGKSFRDDTRSNLAILFSLISLVVLLALKLLGK